MNIASFILFVLGILTVLIANLFGIGMKKAHKNVHTLYMLFTYAAVVSMAAAWTITEVRGEDVKEDYSESTCSTETLQPWNCNFVAIRNSEKSGGAVLAFELSRKGTKGGCQYCRDSSPQRIKLTLAPGKGSAMAWPGGCSGKCSKGVKIDVYNETTGKPGEAFASFTTDRIASVR